jgi:hypothetical protein
MPRASDELRAMFPGHDEEALAYLSSVGLVDVRGLFTVPNRDDYPPRVWAALQYMVDEWDYAVDLVDVTA